MRSFIVILLMCLFVSCSVTKNLLRGKNKKETDTTILSGGEETSKRASDTLEILVPSIVYKDTTIYKRGKSSTVYINYDKQGKKTFGSVCDSINDFKKWYKNERIKEEIKDKTKEKTKETVFKPIFLLYLFIGIAFLMLCNKLMNKFI